MSSESKRHLRDPSRLTRSPLNGDIPNLNEGAESDSASDENENLQNQSNASTKLLYPDLNVNREKKKFTDKPAKKQTDAEPSKNSFCFILIFILFCIFIISVIVFLLFYHASHLSLFSFPPSVSNPEQKDISKIMTELQKTFPRQSAMTLRIIEASLKKVFSIEEPSHPAILLFVSSKNAEDVDSCFATKLAHLLSDLEFLTIRGIDFQYKNPHKAKQDIDTKIQSSLGTKNQTVVLLTDFDKVPSRAATMLHAYCDHESAPYKKAAFLFTVFVNTVIERGLDSKKVDAIADTHLKNVWRDLSADELSPLLSRITVSVAALLPDEFSRHCN